MYMSNKDLLQRYEPKMYFVKTHPDAHLPERAHSSDSGYDETTLVTKQVFSSSDSVEISMGQILRAYQSGGLGSYNRFKLKADDILYNYSKLSIKNNPRIDVMYSQ